MKRLALLVLALAAGLISSQVASAQTYDFTFSGANSGADANASGTGTLVVVGGVITSFSGTFNGISTMTLVAPGGYAANDNDFFPTGSPSYFDFAGASFAAGGVDYNLAYSGYTLIIDSVSDPVGYGLNPTPLAFSATQVPEGGSSLLYLLLASASCFGFMFFASRDRVGSRTMA